jgi:hypothetical protein
LRQRLLNLPGQRVRIIHTPFIRFLAAEKPCCRTRVERTASLAERRRTESVRIGIIDG